MSARKRTRAEARKPRVKPARAPSSRRRRAAPPPPESTPERQAEVLRAALVLFSERGFAGASLRELARRLGVSQPSLYHYFTSKDELLEQVILSCGPELLMAPEIMTGFPARLDEMPRFIVDMVFRIYENPDYHRFLRLIFAVSTEKPRFRAAIQQVYAGGLELGSRVLLAPFVERGEMTEAEGYNLLRMLVNAVGLALIEYTVLYGETVGPSLRAYGDFVAEAGVRLLARREAG